MFDVGIAHAAGSVAGAGQGFMSFLPLILIFGVFYFLLIRPQQKKAKEHQSYLSNMKKGDLVVTSGGLHGSITGLTDTVITLEIAEKVRVKVSRQHILGSASAKEGEACKPAGG
jgi:preprotein translocase subunit YajC